ncbi:MAG: anaerobic glycerol-3-phosphate dehydrogenase subunit A [Desulfobacterales bacterium]|jgi:glycerol-3-phosphate dehydrogenase|nr:anaerobic glycerol-3-phosphate dehydrogenase subunit A [Desulfobacteraceae bacterium]MBT4364630.1 anaerobic glycerol-3-phosphate dehydrogenase subunit A [Desulfobacteraceae bacterium]MBT7084755.1 anaerobic glycerol-3-phosphate dehydrogenase subunit A [Desulfobacterales bacterium]MBT7697913.1 anaerobic glycerol-3-phosphate dehydrogenase subunit A [Desulfobacterales bacterium]
MKKIETDVIIIGGGATGSGVLRDCTLRGIKAVLVEKDDIASGTTGRNHGLLHSGARYATKDPVSAKECIAENRILKKIARHCIEDTGGLFVTLPEDDQGYHDMLVRDCLNAGIDCKEISIKDALRKEPNLNPSIRKALKVPDATIDPFRLAASNIMDSVERGAVVFTHTEITQLITNQNSLTGVRCFDRHRDENFEIYGKVTVNASGIWGQKICEPAGIGLKMYPSKGSMLIIDYRINNVVINRCRKPSSGDIFVPGDTVSLIGTTSKKISYDIIDEPVVDDDEIKILLDEGEKLIPNVSKTRVLRAYCGIRPLVALSGNMDGRDISRGIILIDHKESDGIENFITITGGKLMTYRLMAEKATNLVCKKLNIKKKCLTRKTPIPGSEKIFFNKRKLKPFQGFSNSVVGSTIYRHGTRAEQILQSNKKGSGLICECEMVTDREVKYAIDNQLVKDIVDLRRRTRTGMGPCQGGQCAYRSAGLFTEYGETKGEEAVKMLIDFLEERWKGVKPTLWGDSLREAEFTYWIYQGLFGIGNLTKGFGVKGKRE